LHGTNTTRSLETLKPAQACGEEIQTSDAGAEIDCEGSRAARRAAVPQPRGQHAHGIEGLRQESSQESREENDQEANG